MDVGSHMEGAAAGAKTAVTKVQFKRLRGGRAIRGFVKNAVERPLNAAKRGSSRQAACSTGGAKAPVIIATASDMVIFFGSTTVSRRPRR